MSAPRKSTPSWINTPQASPHATALESAKHNPSWFDISEEDKRSTLVEEKPKALAPRLPIPPHMLRATNMKGRGKNGTKPVGGKRGKFREPGWRNITAGHVADYGVKAWKLAKHIATLINVEEKVFDVDGSAGTTVNSSALVVNLSNIAQGDDYFNRTGDSILGQSIEFRARAFGSTAIAGAPLRVLIVCDKLQRGEDPVIGDVLQGGNDPTVQPYLVPNVNRFDILYDELVELDANGAGLATSGTSTTFVPKREVLPPLIRKWNKHIKFVSSAGADASNWINGLYLMAISSVSSDGPVLRYTFRLRYTDN